MVVQHYRAIHIRSPIFICVARFVSSWWCSTIVLYILEGSYLRACSVNHLHKALLGLNGIGGGWEGLNLQQVKIPPNNPSGLVRLIPSTTGMRGNLTCRGFSMYLDNPIGVVKVYANSYFFISYASKTVQIPVT